MPESTVQERSERSNIAYSRFQYMNAFLVSFNSALLTVQHIGSKIQDPIDPLNYCKAIQSNGVWQIRGREVGNMVSLTGRQSVGIETLRHAIELMDRCKRVFDAEAMTLLCLIHIASTQYRLHQFESAHLIAWTVIEKQANLMWRTHLGTVDARAGGHTVMNAERRKMLAGHNFTASIVTQILSVVGVVDDRLLEQLDQARRKRNAFAHSLDPITAEDAGAAIRTAADVMAKLISMPVNFPLTLGSWV